MSNFRISLGARLSLPEALSFQGELFNIGGEVIVAAQGVYCIGIHSSHNFIFLRSTFRTAAAKARAYLHEGHEIVGGTVAPALNYNRQSPKVMESVITYGCNAPSNGKIAQLLFGQAANGEIVVDAPLICKKDTPYIVEIINDENSQTDAVFISILCCEVDLPS